MTALDLITLADLRAYKPAQGSGADDRYGPLITVASRMLEAELGRRIRYRAPVESATQVYSGSWSDGSPAPTGQPSSTGRTLVVTWTTATAGVLTVTGTVGGVAGQTEAFDAAAGSVQHGVKFFTAVSGLAITGSGAAGTVKVGTSAGYVEYHTLEGTSVLQPLEWPVQNILEMNDDRSRTYGASTKLTAGTDYVLSVGGQGRRSKLTRLTGGFLPMWFFGGWRAGRLTHSAGYTMATIPEDIKDVCRRLTVLLFNEVEKGQIEVASGSNALGTWSRFGPAGVTKSMRAQIARYRRNSFGAETGERDFDLEAA